MWWNKRWITGMALALFTLAGIAHAEIKVGDSLPDLRGFGLEGKLPDNLAGQVILLDFWASWCAPCKSSFPVMEEMHKDYGAKGLVVLAVDVDEKPADMQQFLKKYPVHFWVVRDGKQKLVARVDVPTMPTSLLVDRHGKVRYLHDGFHGAKTRQEYHEEIEKLLQETAGEEQK